MIFGIRVRTNFWHDVARRPFQLNEIRGVRVPRIPQPGALSPKCRGAIGKRFYIMKRKAVNNDLKYQFVASQSALVHKTNTAIPPGDPSISVPGNPDEFQSQIAEVFCGNSMIQGLRNLRNDRFQDCGIEQLLVQLCFVDNDVTGVNARLNLGLVFKGEEDPTADQRRQLVEDICDDFVGVKMPIQRRRLQDESLDLLIDAYLTGSWNAQFADIFVRANIIDCNAFTWENLPHNTPNDKEYFKHIFKEGRTQGIWYFCR